jgi:hypothetical protein
MGWKWEVQQWVKQFPGGYDYEQVYAGQSLLAALRSACRAKRSGAGCVRLEWR